MARQQDVEIFFKVDGLEQYITSLEELNDVLKKVQGETDDVAQAQKKLEDATNDIVLSSGNFEERLNTMEGATKVLAGSFEALAGAAGLLGLESNPFFKELGENVVEVLALSRGIIDAGEGFRLLAQNQRLAAAAQSAFNIVANANPYILLGTAVLAAGAALITFSTDSEEAEQQTRDLNKELEDQINRFNQYNSGVDKAIAGRRRLLQAQQGELTLAQEISFINEQIAVRKEDIVILEEDIKRILIGGINEGEKERYEKLREQLGTTYEQISALELEIQIQKAEDARERRERKEREDDTKNLADETERIKMNLEEIQSIGLGKKTFGEEFEVIIGRFQTLRQEIEQTKQLIINTNQEIAIQSIEVSDTWVRSYQKAFDKVVEDPAVAAEMLKRDVKGVIDFATNLTTIFTKDEEKRAERTFKLGKALSLSNAIINTAEGITTALTDKTQPSTILRILQTAAVAAAGLAQIATISRQTFQGGAGGTNNISPVSALALGGGGSQIGSFQSSSVIETPENRSQPVEAYVLVSNVTSAQQAQTQINRYSRL